MENMDAFENERVFEFVPNSTEPPSSLADSETAGLVAVIVIAAILLITLLFCIAVFIDCRHQKIVKMKRMDRARKNNKTASAVKKAAAVSTIETDKETIADKMHPGELTDPPV